jgi:predicted transcriptional regulator
MSTETVKMSLHMSSEMNERLEKIAAEVHTTKSDVLRRAIFLMDVAVDSRRRGNKIAIVDQADHKISDVIWG